MRSCCLLFVFALVGCCTGRNCCSNSGCDVACERPSCHCPCDVACACEPACVCPAGCDTGYAPTYGGGCPTGLPAYEGGHAVPAPVDALPRTFEPPAPAPSSGGPDDEGGSKLPYDDVPPKPDGDAPAGT